MTIISDLKATDPLERRSLALAIVESLMAENDAAYDIYSPAFDALDEPATIRVFEEQQ